MNLKLENSNCVVLGGSRGIGRSIAIGLAEEGANVAICARGEEALRETENDLRKAEVKAYAATCDNTKESQPEFYESVKASIPAGRLGTPEEVADVAVFVASPHAQWITGECISVDGSQHRGMR